MIPKKLDFIPNLYAVGGCVRDSIMGLVVSDIDITTSLLPDEIEKLCEHKEIKTIDTGKEFGTIIVVIDDVTYEITTFRSDSNYNGRKCKIKFIPNIEEDLARRDFTINAIAINRAHTLIDPYNGAQDIESCLIRSVGDPRKRFKEDLLRIIRACRFSAALGFSIENNTWKAMEELTPLLLGNIAVNGYTTKKNQWQ